MRPKIALVLPNLGVGGAERMMMNLALALSRMDVEVQLVLCSASGPLMEEVPENIKIFDLGKKRVLSSVPSLARYIRTERPLSALSTLTNLNIALMMASTVSGIRLRTVLREASPFTESTKDSASSWEKFFTAYAGIFYRRASAIVAVSSGVRDDLYRRIGSREISVIYNPVVTEDLYRKSRAECGHPWIEDKSCPVILAVGRIDPAKDYCCLIRAFALLNKKRDARLIILGRFYDQPEEMGRIRELIAEFDLGERVSMEGFQKNPFSFMARADILVSSSKWEGLPGVVIQALALGLVPVCTNCPGGTSEILNKPEYGVLVPPQDPEALCSGMEKALSKKWDRGKLVLRARDFSDTRAAKEYLKILVPENEETI